MGERVRKSMINAEVNLLFYFLSLFLAFFSRKIFLDCLGSEFIGLTGTLSNILGYLNLAELGITASIGYFLYRPLQSKNRQEIQNILSLLGYLYNWIGCFILLGGIIISSFFPLIFAKSELGFGIIYFAFYSFLGSSLIGYFINYRQTLLSADQKNYLVAIYMQSAGIVKTGIQIFLAYTYQNLYVWVGIEFLFGLLGCIVLNWKINKEYPWLKVEKRRGRQLLKQYPEIIAKTKQVFIHRIKDFVLRRSDELFIFGFTTLEMVAVYGNYTMIVSKISLMFNTVLNSVNAGVGNLVAEGDKNKMVNVFWELMTIRHFVAGVLSFSIFYFIEPFISLWLGDIYILDRTILVLLVVYIYMENSRGVVDIYNHAHGLYGDVWAAWAELAINITVTIIAGLKWGIAGILLGKIVSVAIIVVLWKPYYLFKSGLQMSVKYYWSGTIRYYLILLVSFIVGNWCIHQIPFSPFANFFSWAGYCLLGLAAYVLCNATLLWIFAKGTKESYYRIKNMRR